MGVWRKALSCIVVATVLYGENIADRMATRKRNAAIYLGQIFVELQCNVGASSLRWGRHGFDGIACGREACRGVDTRNRSQNYKCRTTIRACCLIK